MIGRISASNSARVIALAVVAGVNLRLVAVRTDPAWRESPPGESPGRLRCQAGWTRPRRADSELAPDQIGQDLLHQQKVDVVAAEMGVAVGRQHLEDAVLDAQDRNVERAAAEVVDGDDAACAACRGRRPGTPRSAR